MKALIVYDSVFGNTEKIALAMGDAISSSEMVETTRVGEAKSEQLVGLGLLIVGSPTRGFRPTKEINNFLKEIPKDSLKGVKVAAFDTRISVSDTNSRVLSLFVKIFGYADKPIAKKLKKKGGELLNSPEGFFVKDSEGPLKEGELQRAENWAKELLKTKANKVI